NADRMPIGHLTAGLFPLIRAKPLIGVLFSREDEVQALAKVIVSYGLWQERFGGNPGALGQSIQLDGKAYTVVGVMPRDFAFPDRSVRAWIPYQVRPVVSFDGK